MTADEKIAKVRASLLTLAHHLELRGKRAAAKAAKDASCTLPDSSALKLFEILEAS